MWEILGEPLGCNGIAMTFKREVATARVRRYPIISMSNVQKLRDQSQETCTEGVQRGYRVGTEGVRSYGGRGIDIPLN